MKWLIQTVGGSSAPLVRAINTLNPDRVVFVCSRDGQESAGSYAQVIGQGKVCGKPNEPPSLPNIPTQAGLPMEHVQVAEYVDPDDLSDCYTKIADAIHRIRQEDPSASIFADYTGGTKTMSAALAVAAIDAGSVEIKLVTGSRPDLVRVKDGTESLLGASAEAARMHRCHREAQSLVERFDYAGAESILEEYLATQSSHRELRGSVLFCRAFDAWDRFEHSKASELLANVPGSLSKHREFLGRLSKAEDPAWKSPTGYLFALDLLANAERRATQCRYDDAIGRHYRSVELVAQTYLWNSHKIDAGKPTPEQIPASLPWHADGGASKPLGLMKSWEVAAELDPEVGELFRGYRGKLLHALDARNMSLFAHGTRPVDKAAYEHDREHGMASFARKAIDLLARKGLLRVEPNVPVFPTTLPWTP